jgi:hypothetical protein
MAFAPPERRRSMSCARHPRRSITTRRSTHACIAASSPAVDIDADNLHLLDVATFAFLSMDGGEPRNGSTLIRFRSWTSAWGSSWLGSLGGVLRLAASTPEKPDHVRELRRQPTPNISTLELAPARPGFWHTIRRWLMGS